MRLLAHSDFSLRCGFWQLSVHRRHGTNLQPGRFMSSRPSQRHRPHLVVAPNYAAARSELARSMGLGQKRRKALALAAAAKKGRKVKSAA